MTTRRLPSAARRAWRVDSRLAPRMKQRQTSALLFAAFIVLPVTGTPGCQMVDLPSMAMGASPGSFVPEDDERRLWNRGKEIEERLDRAGVLYADPALTEYVNAIAHRLLPEDFERTGLTLRVQIIRNWSLNAFALPHGALYLHSGILARMENEAQLATLLGHEMAHVILRHAVRNQRSVQNKAGAFATIAALSVPFGAFGAAAQLLAMGGTLAAVTGYSQDLELEADREGLAMMTRAGYDPREAPKLFLQLQEWAREEKKPEPFFFSSHPRLAERLESYQELLQSTYRVSPPDGGGRIGKRDFGARTRGVLMDNAVLDLQAGRFDQARKSITRFPALKPEDSRGYYYMAETYRRQNDPKERLQGIQYYQAAIAAEGLFADAYRGLGTLYYQEGKTAEAAQAFEEYLVKAPAAPDRGYIQNLLEAMRK